MVCVVRLMYRLNGADLCEQVVGMNGNHRLKIYVNVVFNLKVNIHIGHENIYILTCHI